MNISGAFNNLSQSFKDYCSSTKQASMTLIVEMKELRNIPEFFQKTCQVAYASLQLLFLRYPAASSSLSQFSAALLTTANMHDFYRFLRHPSDWMFPVRAEAIDEDLVLENLVAYLEENGFDTEVGGEPADLRMIVKKCVTAQLKQMASNNDGYCNIETFRDLLQKRLRKVKDDNYDFSNVDLTDLNEKNDQYSVAKWMRHTPLVERIMNINWKIVDMLTVGVHLKEWGFLNTAELADRIGQYRCFHWIKDQHLEKWLVGLVCSAYAWRLLESVRKLNDEVLTKQDKNQALWAAITSTAELVLHGSNYLNLIGKTKIDTKYIHCFAIVSKSLGLVSLAIQKHDFFAKPDAASAA